LLPRFRFHWSIRREESPLCWVGSFLPDKHGHLPLCEEQVRGKQRGERIAEEEP
jgi:hypothetical protein